MVNVPAKLAKKLVKQLFLSALSCGTHTTHTYKLFSFVCLQARITVGGSTIRRVYGAKAVRGE